MTQLDITVIFLSFRLTVHYPPILTLTSKRERVLEGDSVRFRCAAESSAGDGSATRFTWFVGGRRVRIDNDAADAVSEFTLESADRRLNGHTVKCEAENAVGRSDVSMLLDVSCEFSFQSLRSCHASSSSSSALLEVPPFALTTRIGETDKAVLNWGEEGSRALVTPIQYAKQIFTASSSLITITEYWRNSLKSVRSKD